MALRRLIPRGASGASGGASLRRRERPRRFPGLHEGTVGAINHGEALPVHCLSIPKSRTEHRETMVPAEVCREVSWSVADAIDGLGGGTLFEQHAAAQYVAHGGREVQRR